MRKKKGQATLVEKHFIAWDKAYRELVKAQKRERRAFEVWLKETNRCRGKEEPGKQ